MISFWVKDYAGAIEHLLGLKPHYHRLGGSVLDNDIVLMTLIEASVRTSTGKDSRDTLFGLILARTLLAERTGLKTSSGQTWNRYAAVLQRMGQHESADYARRTAHHLGIGQGGHFG